MKIISLITKHSWLFAVASALLLFGLPHAAQADMPVGWKTFQGDFFEIGVPPGFVARPVKTGHQLNAVVLTNKKLGVEFAVFSPQWDGEAPFKKSLAGERLVSKNVKKAGKEIAEDITIEATDGSYTRYVLSQTFENAPNGSRTNKTFGITVSDLQTHQRVKNLYIEWKKTLTQFAD